MSLRVEPDEVVLVEIGNPVFTPAWIYRRDGTLARAIGFCEYLAAQDRFECLGSPEKAGLPVTTYYQSIVYAPKVQP